MVPEIDNINHDQVPLPFGGGARGGVGGVGGVGGAALAHDPTLSPESRVWVYTASRRLTDPEAEFTRQQTAAFLQTWTAHNQALLAKSELIDNQLLLLVVDETQAGASGCSIDKSVHFLEQLGQHLGLDWFERMRFGWVDAAGELYFADRAEFAALRQAGTITDSTLVVNTLVQKRGELADQWLIPYAQSWHRRLF